MATITDFVLGDYRVNTPSVSLDDYQEILNLPIYSFNGINKPTERPQYDCSVIWSQTQRDTVARYIIKADKEREAVLGYPLIRRSFLQEEHSYKNGIIVLNNKHLTDIGTLAYEELDSYAIVTSENDDTVTISVTYSSDYSLDDLIVSYPEKYKPIKPLSITRINPTTVSVLLHKARLVKYELLDDRQDPLNFDDSNIYLETVLIYRRYVDTTDAVNLLWPSYAVDTTFGTPATQPALWEISGARGRRLSIISIMPAKVVDDELVKSTFSYCQSPHSVSVNYVAGEPSMSDAIDHIKYAHSMMPYAPVNYSPIELYWADNKKRTENPYMTSRYGDTYSAISLYQKDILNSMARAVTT